MCILAGQEVGIDVQQHRKANYERMLERMVPQDMIREILDADEPEKAFFTQWVLREAYIKWTGEGLSRDLRTISLDEGSYILLDLGEDYSGAIWSQDHLELQWEHVDVAVRNPSKRNRVCNVKETFHSNVGGFLERKIPAEAFDGCTKSETITYIMCKRG
ncbi:MAG: 4'-phosphopantetheinyl transferase family protein [Lachnospiraceae bacterium]